MKLYISGKISLISAVAALVACIEQRQGFDLSNPILFWGIQILFAASIIIALCFTLSHWDMSYHIPKKRVLLSIVNIVCLYMIAWTNFRYSWLLILLCSMTEIYALRQRLQKPTKIF